MTETTREPGAPAAVARPSLVCFDIGGVLVRIYRSWADVCRGVGFEPRGDWTSEAHARAHETLIELFGTGKISEEEWSQRLSIALGGCFTPAELRQIHQAWGREQYRGATELVDDLHAAGVETACLSNTTHGHWIRLTHQDEGRPLPGAPEFPAVPRLRRHFASHLLGLAKPDPAIYRAFEAATGRTGPDILFFDDLAPNVTAAQALGWNAVLVDPESETVPQIRRHLARHRLL
jgi:FMN phosphatase YigB (HAD superfamily)